MLSEKAILARLVTGLPGQTRQDKQLTEKIQSTEHLGHGAGKWIKSLYPPEALESARRIQGYARLEHYRLTLPWDDQGWRILPTATYFDYMERIRIHIDKFKEAKDEFLANWQKWVDWAKRTHNSTFNPALYDKDTAEIQFTLKSIFEPVPDSNDFRIALQTDEAEAMQKELDSRTEAAIEKAMLDLWIRLAEPVKAMIDKLAVPDAIFRDSLVGNIKEIVALVPKLNLTGDTALDAFAKECEAKLAVWEPDVLRHNNRVRATTAQMANDIYQRMQELMPK